MKKLTDEEREYQALLENIRSLMSGKGARGLVWHILSMCDLYSDAFAGNSRTFYIEGKRAIGLGILQLLDEADPTIYPRMLLEKAKEIKNG